MSRKVREAMEPFFSERFFNPSAAYWPAKEVAAAYQAAKGEIAHAIGAKAADLTITGSATEANNLALTSLSEDGEALVLATEHDSVRKAVAQRYERKGAELRTKTGEAGAGRDGKLFSLAETEAEAKAARTGEAWEIAVDRNGTIDLADLRSKITERTELVSVALVNNELGTIQPLAEIARILREVRLQRLRAGSKRPIWLHADASQALNLLDVNVARLGVDLLTLNAAKIYGPKGVGALYCSHAVCLQPLTLGGGQENGLRSGTENVAGVIGFAVAMTEAKQHLAANRRKYAELKRVLLANLEGYELINGGRQGKLVEERDLAAKRGTQTKFAVGEKNTRNDAQRGRFLDNFVVLCYNGIDGERLVYALEEQGVYVATGAACAASKGEKSHVLAAIGLSEAEIAGSLRITLGETNTKEQMIEAARIINATVAIERERVARGAGRINTSKRSDRPERLKGPNGPEAPNKSERPDESGGSNG